MMGWTITGTVETDGETGLEPKLLKSVIEGARDRLSMGRIVANGGGEACDEFAGVGDVLNPLDFTTLETLAFTRTAGLVEGLSGERRGEGGAGSVCWNESLLRRDPMTEASSVEVKERCLDNSWGPRDAFGLEV